MGIVIAVGIGWLVVGAAVALLIGGAARERPLAAPVPTPAPEHPSATGRDPVALPPMGAAALVAMHGLLQSASILQGGLENLRSSWHLVPAADRDRLLDRLLGHAAILEAVLEAHLADAPQLRHLLDSLQRDPAGASVDAGPAA